MRCLVDTGILLRIFKRKDPLCEPCRQSIIALLDEGAELCSTVQNATEFLNVRTRPASSRGGFGQPVEDSIKLLGILERYGDVLVESIRSYLEWKRLVERYSVTGVSVHDTRLVSVMLVHRVSHILTLDGAGFGRYEEIEVISPHT